MEMKITAKLRSVFGRHNKKLRASGMLPAVLYGKRKDSVHLEVDKKIMDKVFKKAGENTLVDLVIDGQDEKKVLIHDVAKHFMKNEIIHVDFYEVDLKKKVHIKVPLQFDGVSPAVKEQGGILVKMLDEVDVETLPSNLPQFINVDLGKLKTFQDMIRIADIILPSEVFILTSADEVVVSVQPPRTEEELASMEQSTAEQEKAAIESMTAQVEKEKAEKATANEDKDKSK